MMKYMTMKNFMQNPTGKYSASFARRDLIITGLVTRYNQLIKKCGSFKYTVFEDGDDYIFHIKVPSERFGNKCIYDVVINFRCINPTMMKMALTLKNYALNVYSNAPNFTFTYAYVYNKDGIIPDFMLPKVAEKAITDEPVVKNPGQSYGFEKSVYYALLFIKNSGLDTKIQINKKKDKKMTIEKLLENIPDSYTKLVEYNNAKAAEMKLKKLKNKIKDFITPDIFKKNAKSKKKNKNSNNNMAKPMSTKNFLNNKNQSNK